MLGFADPVLVLRGCLPKSGTVVVGLKLQFFSFFVP